MVPIEEIVETFELLDDWEERYRYVIDLGRQLPAMPESEKTEENRVKGCTSRVWLVEDVSGDTVTLRGDSDAHIVRGLVAILLSLYSGKTPAEILQIDARAFLDKLGLESHLSPTRASGLVSMVERIRSLAAARQAA